MTALISPFDQWKTSSESKQIFYLLTFSSSFYDLKKTLKTVVFDLGRGKRHFLGGDGKRIALNLQDGK